MLALSPKHKYINSHVRMQFATMLPKAKAEFLKTKQNKQTHCETLTNARYATLWIPDLIISHNKTLTLNK